MVLESDETGGAGLRIQNHKSMSRGIELIIWTRKTIMVTTGGVTIIIDTGELKAGPLLVVTESPF